MIQSKTIQHSQGPKSKTSSYLRNFRSGILIIQSLMILSKASTGSAFTLRLLPKHRMNSVSGQTQTREFIFPQTSLSKNPVKANSNIINTPLPKRRSLIPERSMKSTCMAMSMSSGDLKSDGINFEESGFSFEFGSFDQKGKWLNVDWDEKEAPSIPPGTPYDNFQPDSDVRIGCYSPDEPSPVQLSLICDRMVYVKRDDLLYLHKSNVSGNKARKLLALNELSMDEFPDAIVSYGGPQSNAMLALAAIVNSRNVELAGLGDSDGDDDTELKDEIENDIWLHGDDEDANDSDDDDSSNLMFEDDLEDDDRIDIESQLNVRPEKRKKRFVYYTKKLPRYLRNQPSGNLLRALSLGMELKQVSNDEYKEMFGSEDGGSAFAPSGIDAPIPMKSLWVPQGGFCGVASQGAKLMADEIVSFWDIKGNGMPLTVCLPGGTCTTAMLLCREINALIASKKDNAEGSKDLDIKVAVIPCVGDKAYAKRQMVSLDTSTGGNGRDDIPEIFDAWKYSYPRFGEPTIQLLRTFTEMKDKYSLYVDLLYGAPAWNLLLKYLTSQRESPIKNRQVMYVHSGGLEGISSQLTRYKHKGLLDGDDQMLADFN